jgi:type III secretion protein L
MIIHKIANGKIEIDRGQKIIRHQQYQSFLSASQTRQTIAQEQRCARQKSENIFQEMKTQGHREGKEEARQEMLQQQIEFSRAAILWTENLEKEVFQAMTAMMDKIIGAHDKNEITKEIIKKTLKLYAHLPELKLHVAPEQKELAQHAVNEIAKEYNIKLISVEEDERLKKGDCILESPIGSVDASLDTQLKVLKELLAKNLSRTMVLERVEKC